MKKLGIAIVALAVVAGWMWADDDGNAVTTGAGNTEKKIEGRGGRMGGGPGGERGMRGPGGQGAGRGTGGGIVDMQQAIISRILESPEMAEKLGLTQEQISSIKASMNALNEEQKKLMTELEESGVEQAKLLTADTTDETAVMAAVEKSSKIRGELAKLMIKRILIAKKALTPEQIQKVKDMVQERRKAFEERRKTFEEFRNKGGGDKPRGGAEKKHEKPQEKGEHSTGATL